MYEKQKPFEGKKMDKVITVWKDGTWKLWDSLDAQYAANDKDWLVNIPISNLFFELQDMGLASLNSFRKA